MNPIHSLAGLPPFLAYLGVALLLMLVYTLCYVFATPHREFQLIREGNTAAAIAFSGSLIGFTLPLHSAISNSVNLIDCAIWGLVALVIQIAAFAVLRLLVRDLPGRIAKGENASAILVAAASISIGLLNAACMSY